LSDADDVPSDIAPKDAGEPAGASGERAAPFPRAFNPAVSAHAAWARRAKRDGNGKFVRVHEPRPKPDKPVSQKQRSRVTNGTKKLFLTGPAGSATARRFSDILRSIISDLGGRDAPLSEGQRQLARRAASLSLACERLEESVFTGSMSAAEQAFMSATGGLSPYVILREASKALHGIAHVKGGDTISAMAKLPPEELGVVTDLLCRAGDLAARCIQAGSAQSADLELLGLLSDRLGRTFGRLGMARVPREVGIRMDYPAANQREAFSPLRAALAKDVQDVPPVDPDALEPIDVPSEAAEP
jgi:hypothetical protein